MINAAFDLSFEEAVSYWEWREPRLKKEFAGLAEEMKDRAFVISKLTKYEHLNAVYQKIGEAIAEGKPTDTILKELKSGKNGVPLSEAHLRTVLRTNLASAYSAGRWVQVQKTKENRPYLKILVIDDGRSHDLAFKDMVFHIDDPFWSVNWPPFHFNCRCEAISLSDRQVEILKEQLGYDPVIKTTTPIPINQEFARRPGTPHRPDLSDFDPVFRERFLNDAARRFGVDEAGQIRLKRYFNEGDVKDALLLSRVGTFSQRNFNKLVKTTLKEGVSSGCIMPVGKLPADVVRFLKRNGNSPKFSLITIDDKQILHMQRTVKKSAGKSLTVDEILKIPSLLKSNDSRWYLDTKENNLLVFTGEGTEIKKVAINMKSDAETPYIVTTGKVNGNDENKIEYKRIK